MRLRPRPGGCSASRSSSAASPSSGRSRIASADLVGAVAEAGEGLAHVGQRRRGPPPPAPPPRRPTGDAAASRSGTSRRDLSSTSRRAAVFLPTPGHQAQGGEVVVGQDPRSERRRRAPTRMARASAGPTPWAPSSASKHDALVARWRSRRGSRRPRGRWWWIAEEDLVADLAQVDGGGRGDRDPVADAGHLDEDLAGAASGRAACPAASRSSPHPRSASGAARPRPAGGAHGPGGTGPGRRHRRRRPGWGGRGEAEEGLHHLLHLLLVGAAPAGDGLLHLVRGVLHDLAARRLTASAMAMPLAWPTDMAVRTLTWKSTRSTATHRRAGARRSAPAARAGARPGAAGSGLGGGVRSTPRATARGVPRAGSGCSSTP